MPNISRYATVESSHVADDVIIGPFTYIGPDVVIASGCRIDENVIIAGKTTLERDCHVFPRAQIGHPTFFDGCNICIIGQANRLREHVTVLPGKDSPTEIAHDCLIMGATSIGASAKIGSHVVLANSTTIGHGAIIEDYVRSSAFPIVDDNVRVGAYSFMNGYAHISSDAPPYAMLEGDPFGVRGVNTHNLSQCGFGADDIRALKYAYREIYNGKQARPNPDVIARLLADADTNPLVRQAVEAIRAEVSS
jgi:UDP-N-acetylglucosamine acyltransferase